MTHGDAVFCNFVRVSNVLVTRASIDMQKLTLVCRLQHSQNPPAQLPCHRRAAYYRAPFCL